MEVLDSGRYRASFKDWSRLRSLAEEIRSDAELILHFDRNRERFKTRDTAGFAEWALKQLIRATSRSDIFFRHHSLAYRIRRFHADFSSILSLES
jgi:hypothetical protein